MKFTTKVTRGQGRGKTLGFPTLNLQIPQNFTAQSGIYTGYVWLHRHKYLGAFHYGPRPAFKDKHKSLEVFVLGYSSNSLINQLTFQLVHYLRPIRNFSTPAALARQISLDIKKTRQLLS